MPIEFPCQQCGEQVRTPDAAAGKKGRCPACGEIQRIPLPATPSATAVLQPVRRLVELDDLSFADEPAPAPPQPEPTTSASKPKTTSRLQPLSELQALPAAARAQPRPATAAAKAPAPSGPSIRFQCGKCGYKINAPIALAGRKGACPKCHVAMVIPGGAKPTLAALPTLMPLNDPSGGLTALDDAPLDELLPLDGEQEEPPMLIPLGPAPAARPATAPGGGSANPFGDPLAHLPVARPSAGVALGPAAVNPYSSPSAGYASSQQHRRTGLPWDYEGVGPGTFLDTARMVLTSPVEAFQKMSTTGGIGGPMGFAVGGMVLGNLMYLFYYFAFLVLLTGGDAAGALGFTFLVLVLGMSMVVALSGATMGLLLWSAVVHATLSALGGGGRGFEATYRTYAYCLGSSALTLAIPCLGGFTYPLGMLVLPIIGLRQAHRSEYWQILLACISPFVLFVVLSVFIGLLSRFV